MANTRTEYGVRRGPGRVELCHPDEGSRTVMSDEDYTRKRAGVLGGVPVSRTVTELRSDWTPLPFSDASQTSELTVTLTVTDQRRALRWLVENGDIGGIVAVDDDHQVNEED